LILKKIKKINYNLVKDKIDLMSDDKKSIALGLLKELIYMNDTLEKLKEKIDEKGVVTEMCQGNYSIDRTNPALQTYNALIKNYTSTSKQLFEMLPNSDDDVDNFDFDDLT
jgi:hypothetical protein